MRMWGCKDTNKHTVCMNLRIRGCEDTRFQTSTHKPEDMRMQGCEWGYLNLRIWGCKDARIQASTHEHKDIRMRGCKDTSKCTEPKDMRMWGYKQVKHIKHLGYVFVTTIYFTPVYTLFIFNSIYLIIFWCMIHQTLPDLYNQAVFLHDQKVKTKI